MIDRRAPLSDELPRLVAGSVAILLAAILVMVAASEAAVGWTLSSANLLGSLLAGSLWGSLGAVLLIWILICVSPATPGFATAVIFICTTIWCLIGGGAFFIWVSVVAAC